MFGPLLHLFSVICDLLGGLGELFSRVCSLHRLENLSGFLIHLSLQARIVWFLLECFHRLCPLGILLLQLLISILRLFGQLTCDLFTATGHILGLSDLMVSHQGLRRLCLGQLSLSLFILLKIVLIDQLVKVRVHGTELLLGLLNLFGQLISFFLQRLLGRVRVGTLRLPCSR